MDVREAAALFRAWALNEGLVFGDQAYPPVVNPDFSLISNNTAPGRTFLRNKQIQAIGFDESNDEIVVYLRKSASITKKSREYLPDFVADFGVRYSQALISAVDASGLTPTAANFAIRQTAAGQHYTCGSSISIGNYREAGTLACLLRDAQGEMFGLSNNHIVGACSQAPLNMPIVAPGVLDVNAGGCAPFTIGFYSNALQLISGSWDTVPFLHNSDAAIFKVSNPSLISSYQQDHYDTPAATMPLTAGLTVEKVGRTTGHRPGVVDSEILGPFPIPYHALGYNFQGPVYFDKAFLIKGMINTGSFSEAGDSGSLIVHRDVDGSLFAVGLVFAGSQDNKAPGGFVTLALPIEPILAALNMTLVSGHNV